MGLGAPTSRGQAQREGWGSLKPAQRPLTAGELEGPPPRHESHSGGTASLYISFAITRVKAKIAGLFSLIFFCIIIVIICKDLNRGSVWEGLCPSSTKQCPTILSACLPALRNELLSLQGTPQISPLPPREQGMLLCAASLCTEAQQKPYGVRVGKENSKSKTSLHLLLPLGKG